jgi:crotonobetainyl-CoA:carnitine CoA-transferase CaiB-like acyl-CoA transferase
MATPMALSGLKVVECATVIAAPFCGRLLADFGAEVIHVEPPGKGDHLRQFGFTKDEINPWWKLYDRNKTLITLDISKPRGREVLFRLLADADIFIENFRPGRLEEWGITWEELSRLNPRLVMVRLTGFGQTGPYAAEPGFGTIIEAMSGFAHMTGEPDGPPTMPAFALADSVTGLYAAMAAMFAVYSRDIVGTGRGQVIDCAIWEGLFSILGPNATVHQLTGQSPTRMGNRVPTSAPRNTYRTRDGRWIVIAGATQTTAMRLLTVVGGEALARDPRFATNMLRVQNVAALDEHISAWMAARTFAEVTATLKECEVPVGPINTIADIMADPHAIARQMIIDVPDEHRGSLKQEGVFPRMTGTPGQARHTGKSMGADNVEIFARRLGMSEAEMADLKRQGII